MRQAYRREVELEAVRIFQNILARIARLERENRALIEENLTLRATKTTKDDAKIQAQLAPLIKTLDATPIKKQDRKRTAATRRELSFLRCLLKQGCSTTTITPKIGLTYAGTWCVAKKLQLRGLVNRTRKNGRRGGVFHITPTGRQFLMNGGEIDEGERGGRSR